ncbi:ATP-binding protein [Streptomyces sp. NPDC054796]
MPPLTPLPGSSPADRPAVTVCWAQSTYPHDKGAVGTARDFAVDALTRWGLPEELREDVRMCVSEAATNAVIHTAAAEGFDVSLDLLRTEAELRVHVGDGDPDRVPVRACSGPEGVNGRGLHLITSLAHDFTVTVTPTGKTVSFSFGIPQRIPGAAR